MTDVVIPLIAVIFRWLWNKLQHPSPIIPTPHSIGGQQAGGSSGGPPVPRRKNGHGGNLRLRLAPGAGGHRHLCQGEVPYALRQGQVVTDTFVKVILGYTRGYARG